jgi:hypothetical protein
MTDKSIGFLIASAEGNRVLCHICYAEKHSIVQGIEIYYENVYPYSQTCCYCAATVVQGLANWPELFVMEEK